jgi:hypothetical protein
VAACVAPCRLLTRVPLTGWLRSVCRWTRNRLRPCCSCCRPLRSRPWLLRLLFLLLWRAKATRHRRHRHCDMNSCPWLPSSL